MNKKNTGHAKAYMTLDYDFTGIRVQEGFLTPVDWKLSVDLYAIEKKSVSRDDVEAKAGLTFQKIYFWLNTNLPGILVADVSNEEDMYIVNLSSNIMMFCPGNPGDDLIIRLLHAKLTSLCGEDLFIGQIRLSGSDTPLKYVYECYDGDYSLPKNTEEYYTEYPCRDMAPWWTRDDGFCFEFAKADTPELEELSKGIIDPMDDFYKIIEEMGSTAETSKELARVITVEKWKPRKV